MHLGISALNIRGGGGRTHLVEVLAAAEPHKHGFERVTLWSGQSTLDCVEDRPWLHKIHCPEVEGSFLSRILWERFSLHRVARDAKVDLLFAPGGVYTGRFHPFVAMSQNMLPFERKERKRFGLTKTSLRYLLLRITQANTFRKADGVIFLSEYARSAITKQLSMAKVMTEIIPHGIDDSFRKKPRVQQRLTNYSIHNPFRFVYVSIINFYKHQWNVARAVATLRNEGLPACIQFVGPAHPPALKHFRAVQEKLDPDRTFIKYTGAIPYKDLPSKYHNSDAFVFASSCENMPNILLEAMASGLPIACSNLGPMPEVLGDAGIYFDPESPGQIVEALGKLCKDEDLRKACADKAFAAAQRYTWNRTAQKTFSFLGCVAEMNAVPS